MDTTLRLRKWVAFGIVSEGAFGASCRSVKSQTLRNTRHLPSGEHYVIGDTDHVAQALALPLYVYLECFQTTVPIRYATISDILSNTPIFVIGLIAALLLL